MLYVVQMSVSHARSPVDNLQHPLNTPRMLELDINRMLIGQNNVSTKLPHPPTDDRLMNASNNSLRSYVTVQRPTASLQAERPPSVNGEWDVNVLNSLRSYVEFSGSILVIQKIAGPTKTGALIQIDRLSGGYLSGIHRKSGTPL